MVQSTRRRLILSLFLCAGLGSAQSVFFYTLDGLGDRILRQDPAAQELRVLRRVMSQGVTAQGVQAAFPSTTGNSHAALYTGAYGDVNNITANDMPALPRAGHTFRERSSGYRSDQLAAEPVWAAAARQGVKTAAYQVTQAYPFLPVNTAPGATVLNSYQTLQVAPHNAVRARDVEFEAVAGWTPALPKSLRVRKGFKFRSGPLAFYGAIIDDAVWVAISKSGTRIRVTPEATEGQPPLNRELARHFSKPLSISEPASQAIYFRLFELAPDGHDFLLYHSSVSEVGVTDGSKEDFELRRQMLGETGGVIGNGASALLNRGAFGDAATDVAHRRYMETVELVTRQNLRQTLWLHKKLKPRLLIGYLPFPDEFDHQYLALDAAGNQLARQMRAWGYQIVDRWLAGVCGLAKGGDHLVVASDHGMAPVRKSVSVDALMRRAGLSGQVAYVYNSVLVNTTDWKGGTVKPEEKAAVVAKAQAALESAFDPETGQRLFTAFFRPETHGSLFGIGGPAGADLYFDLAPGWNVYNGREGALFPALIQPRGVHGFLPTREEMLAICVARGPKLPRGAEWPRLRSIDVAPLVAQLLAIDPPKQAQGKSPLGK
jgi:hypothetical protein